MSLLVPTLTVQVIFSDETTVELGHKAKPFVRRSKGCRIREVHTVRNVTFARKVMFWGIISAKGPGCLVPVQGTLNAERYVNLLQQYLLPQAATWFPNSPWEFQQDNAPCHKQSKPWPLSISKASSSLIGRSTHRMLALLRMYGAC